MKGRGVLLSRWPWALAFVGLLGALLAHALGSQSARVLLREPLVPRSARGSLVAVPLVPGPSAGGVRVHAIALTADAPSRLAEHQELWLFLDLPGASSRLRAARLVATGTACRLEFGPVEAAPAAEPAPDEGALVLRRSGECQAAEAERPGTLRLEVTASGEEPVGLWAYSPRAADGDRGPIRVAPGSPLAGSEALSVRGLLIDRPPTAPRVELLNAMWRLSGEPSWIWWSLAGALALVLAGCLLSPSSPADPESRATSRRVIRSAIGCALPALGLAALYAVLTPPLFGPDEPYHLLGFADLGHDARLADDTLAWMGQTHVLRIRYRPEERFRSVDPGRPFVGDDDQLKPTEVSMRSATLACLWRALGPALRGRGAPQTLLALRLVNALAFALAVGAAAALAAACAGTARPQWLVFPFLFVPSLPFFAMHVSETAVLCSAYVLFSASIAVLFLDGPRAHWAGFPLGLATALMLAGGRSPWPLAAVVVAALAARVLLGANGAQPRRAAAVFWSGLALGLGAYWLALNDDYLLMMSYWSRFVPHPLRPLWDSQGRAALAVLLALALAAGLESGLLRWRERAAARLGPSLRRPARWAASAVGAGVVVSLAGSLVLQYPHLPLEPRHPMSVGERVAAVLATMATLFRLSDPNFLLATTFWVGFGWLDAIPGPVFQALLVALVGVAAVGLLRALARPPQLRRLAWLLALAGGGVLALVLYTVVTQDLPMALQGRYLIGWYLVFLTLAGSWLTGLSLSPSATVASLADRLRPALLLLLAGGLHAYCLGFILRRYF
jgi:hypothetical protein